MGSGGRVDNAWFSGLQSVAAEMALAFQYVCLHVLSLLKRNEKKW